MKYLSNINIVHISGAIFSRLCSARVRIRLFFLMLGGRGVDFLSFACHSSSSLTTFAFRSREVRRFLLNLDSYCGTDQLGMFPRSFFKDK